MTLWKHAETPFGNIVYSLAKPNVGEESGPTGSEIVVWGAGTLSAAEALAPNWQGDITPNSDALKAEAVRQAEEAGAPFQPWYRPDPAVIVNGKPYHSSFVVTFYDAQQERTGLSHYAGRVIVNLPNATEAAGRKLGDWFAEARSSLLSPENLQDWEKDRAISRARRATEKKNEANKVARAAREESFAADLALARFGIVLDLNGKVI